MADIGSVGLNSVSDDTVKFAENECMAVYQKVRDLSGQVKNVRSEIGSITGNSIYWIGKASDRFRDECKKLTSELDRLGTSLDNNAQGLLNAVTILNDTEQHVEMQVGNELSTDNVFVN